ncbi:MAG: 30S ribosomal protein S8 [Syntrophomonas sp.]|uniref:30S ribosomal protein S8 n=1 Tax=Syntrophomonas sp. TaxID=2053627 RepID=UPI00260EC63C|nr:30S ribosomal protein S8 [Syntrophomonas sp.]MDD2509606.1 30S ribosomal protein S8 [Syntrophomonas sp.]MDD3879542.1 30S ribosomal protein S8 [Syntrophomonas sp.]MDD4626253.1 30S ribosomal protein S8 [Syntrophomonas sp.]
MVMTDPVADLLTRIRNGNMVMHETVEVPGSRIKLSIAQIMQEEGYIKDYEFVEDGKQGIIRIYLKYGPDKKKVITGIKRISKPGLRVYVKKDEIPRVLGGLGTAVISTSKGLMTDKKARKEGLGGEVVCYIW